MRVTLSSCACALVLAVVGSWLSGCGSEPHTGGGGSSSLNAVTADQWCEREGLARALRQTVILIDERAISPGIGAEFRTANSALFEAVNALGSAGAVASGAMAPRERLSLFLIPSDGAAPRLVYTGCAPGMSAEETVAAREGRSALGDFVGGDLAGELENASETHTRIFITSFARLGDRPAPPPIRSASFAQSSLLSSLKSVRQLAREGAGVPRYIIFTDLMIFPGAGDATAARRAGFAAASEARVALGGAEVVLLGSGAPGGGSSRHYAEAFFLGSQGDLLGWGTGALGSLPAAPVSVKTYAGELRYPTDRYPARMIIGRDRANRLVNSWLIVNSDAEWATPIGGSLSCSGDVCSLVQDRSGLGQQWNPDTDPVADFNEVMPLSGMRGLRATITPETTSGEVFDPEVTSFEGFAGVSTLPFELNALRQTGD
jgi:hypothetical protein